ncbi:MAG: hypothetical protein JOZ08_02705 [Verrucomicrobia bacterium]|nr:hypothetical protein [Verrucomicrobiota bacterium]
MSPRLLIGWCITQAVVFLLWIPFRASHFSDTVQFLTGITSWRTVVSAAQQQVGPIPWMLLLLPIACDTFIARALRNLREKPALNPELAFSILIVAALSVALIAKTGLRTFIYFQF